MKPHNRSQAELNALVTPTAIEQAVSEEKPQAEPPQIEADVPPIQEAAEKEKPTKTESAAPKKRRVAEPIEKTISLRVSEVLLNDLNEEAAIQGKSRSHVLQTAARAYVDKMRRKRAREQEKQTD